MPYGPTHEKPGAPTLIFRVFRSLTMTIKLAKGKRKKRSLLKARRLGVRLAHPCGVFCSVCFSRFFYSGSDADLSCTNLRQLR